MTMPPTLLDLPPELLGNIWEELTPVGSITTSDSTGNRPQITASFLRSRGDLANLCRITPRLTEVATKFLYRTVLIQNQDELLNFLRTLATVPALRSLVRCFIWAGSFSSSSDILDVESYQKAKAIWQNTGWPATDDEILIADLMGLNTPDTPLASYILGAVLGLIPRVKTLFLCVGRGSGAEGGPEVNKGAREIVTILEHDSISLLLNPKFHTSDAKKAAAQTEAYGFIFSSGGNRFLQEVETLILEPYDDSWSSPLLATFIIRHFLVNSRFLRHVEIKKGASWVVLGGKYPPVVSKTVTELHSFGNSSPKRDISAIVTAFPNLTKLSYETSHGPRQPTSADGRSYQYTNLADDLNEVQHTLTVLSITSATWTSWQCITIPPMLSTNIDQLLHLKHLRTECIWLFGRNNPSQVLESSFVLPPALASFSLTDYWGICEDLPPFPPDPRPFYPDFGQGCSPLDFLEKVLTKLHHACTTNRTDLRDIVIASPYFYKYVGTITPDDGSLALRDRFQTLFAEIGVCFSVTDPIDMGKQVQASWARV